MYICCNRMVYMCVCCRCVYVCICSCFCVLICLKYILRVNRKQETRNTQNSTVERSNGGPWALGSPVGCGGGRIGSACRAITCNVGCSGVTHGDGRCGITGRPRKSKRQSSSSLMRHATNERSLSQNSLSQNGYGYVFILIFVFTSVVTLETHTTWQYMSYMTLT